MFSVCDKSFSMLWYCWRHTSSEFSSNGSKFKIKIFLTCDLDKCETGKEAAEFLFWLFGVLMTLPNNYFLDQKSCNKNLKILEYNFSYFNLMYRSIRIFFIHFKEHWYQNNIFQVLLSPKNLINATVNSNSRNL